jgi:hypothetical protein
VLRHYLCGVVLLPLARLCAFRLSKITDVNARFHDTQEHVTVRYSHALVVGQVAHNESADANEAPNDSMWRTWMSKLSSGLSRIGGAIVSTVQWLRPTPYIHRRHGDVSSTTCVRRGYDGRKAATARKARQAAAAARRARQAAAADSIFGRVLSSAKAAFSKIISRASYLSCSVWEKITFLVTFPLRGPIGLNFPSRTEIKVRQVLPWTQLSSVVNRRCWYNGVELDTTRSLWSLGILPGSTLTCLGRQGPRASPSASSVSSSTRSSRASAPI